MNFTLQKKNFFQYKILKFDICLKNIKEFVVTIIYNNFEIDVLLIEKEMLQKM